MNRGKRETNTGLQRLEIKFSFIVFTAATLWVQCGAVLELIGCPAEAKWGGWCVYHGSGYGKFLTCRIALQVELQFAVQIIKK